MSFSWMSQDRLTVIYYGFRFRRDIEQCPNSQMLRTHFRAWFHYPLCLDDVCSSRVVGNHAPLLAHG
jgi:hypothetical protein